MSIRVSPLTRASALIIGVGLLAAVPVHAAKQEAVAPAAAQAVEDPLRRETPRGSFMGFVEASQRGNHAVAADYLQWPRQKLSITKEEAATQLRFILNHGFEGNLDRLSRDPGGTTNDGLALDRERAGVAVLANGERVDIYLTRVPQTTGPALWLIAADTVSDIPRMYENAGLPGVERRLPKVLTDTSVGHLQLWVPLALLVLVPVLALVSGLLFWLVVEATRLVLRFRGKTVRGRHSPIVRALSFPTVLIVTIVLHRLLSPRIGIPLLHRQYYSRTVTVLLLAAVVWWVWRLIDLAAGRTRDLLEHDHPRTAQTVFSLGRRLLKGLVAFVAFLIGLASFGVDLTATLAGLGIGGVALAFGLQKTLENVFGGIFVLSDRSIVVGDFCQIGKFAGEVEDVGLRSMQLRTANRTVVSVPNGTLATMEVENFSRRDKFLFNPIVGLRYGTTLEQLQQVVAGIAACLAADGRIEASTRRVRFIRFGASSLDVEVYAYIKAPDYAASLGVQEELLMRIMGIVQDAGTGLAIPSQAMYVRADQQAPVAAPGTPFGAASGAPSAGGAG